MSAGRARERSQFQGPSHGTVRAFNDRYVSGRTVPCPVCNAAEGVHCSTPSGKRIYHEPRRRMALRAQRSAAPVDVEALAWLRTIRPVARKVARKRLGLTQVQMATRTRASQRTVRDWEAGRANPSGSAGSAYAVLIREALS